jgi:hypothetical protein
MDFNEETLSTTVVFHRHPLADDLGLDDRTLAQMSLIISAEVPSRDEVQPNDANDTDESYRSAEAVEGPSIETDEPSVGSQDESPQPTFWSEAPHRRPRRYEAIERLEITLGPVVEDPKGEHLAEQLDSPTNHPSKAGASSPTAPSDTSSIETLAATVGAVSPNDLEARRLSVSDIGDLPKLTTFESSPVTKKDRDTPPFTFTAPNIGPMEYTRMYLIEQARVDQEGGSNPLPAPEKRWAWTHEEENLLIIPRMPPSLDRNQFKPSPHGSPSHYVLPKSDPSESESNEPLPSVERGVNKG